MRAPLALFALLAWATPSLDEHGAAVQARLAALSAPSAAERDAAQRWLAARLTPGDVAVLRSAVRNAGAEARLRLAQAIAADDRRLSIAASLFVDRDPVAAEVGSTALDALIARWCSACGADPEPAARVAESFRERDLPLLELAAGEDPLDDALELLARRGGVDLPLALDPDLDGARSLPRPGAWGNALELLFGLTRIGGLEVEGCGRMGDGENFAWLHVVPAGRGGLASGRELLRRWCRSVARGDSRAVASARALAGTGWPAALEWFAERFAASGDPAALEGLLLAAGRGHVHPLLADVEIDARLFALADRALAARSSDRGDEGERIAARVARALARVPALARDGRELCVELVSREDLTALPDDRLWVRLLVLGGRRSDDPRVARPLAELARARERSPALRRLALQALAAAPPSGDAPPLELEVRSLAVDAARAGQGPALAAALAATGAGPADAPARLAADDLPAVALIGIEWLALTGRVGEARDALATRPERWVSPGPAHRAALSLLTRLAEREGIERLASSLDARLPADASAGDPLAALVLAAGLVTPDRAARWYDPLMRAVAADPRRWPELARLAAGARGPQIRRRLVSAIAAAGARTDPALARALVRAAGEAARALARSLDPGLQSFVDEVRGAAATAGGSIGAQLAPDRWPPRLSSEGARIALERPPPR